MSERCLCHDPPGNGDFHKNVRVFNRCPHSTLGLALDENCLPDDILCPRGLRHSRRSRPPRKHSPELQITSNRSLHTNDCIQRVKRSLWDPTDRAHETTPRCGIGRWTSGWRPRRFLSPRYRITSPSLSPRSTAPSNSYRSSPDREETTVFDHRKLLR